MFLTIEEIDYHIFINGIDPNYTIWTMHGAKDLLGNNRFVDDDKIVDNNEFFNFEYGIPTDAPNTIEMVEGIKENFSNNPNMFKLLFEDSEKPL